MRHHHYSVAVILALCSCTASLAARPELIEPNDPRGDEVRATAAEFLNKLAQGDTPGARALFAGDEEQTQLLDAYVNWVNNSAQLAAALQDRFGDRARMNAIDAAYWLQSRSTATNPLVIVSGDRASIAPRRLIDHGLELRRVAGKWKVTHICPWPEKTTAVMPMMQTLADENARVAADIKADPSLALDEVRERLERIGQEAVREWAIATMDEPATMQPPDAPEGHDPVAVVELTASIGTPFTMKQIKQLAASFAGLPRVYDNYDTVFVHSAEEGIAFTFDDPSLSLRAIAVYAHGVDGYRGYRGVLPHGLNPSDRRRDVERKLGRPDQSSGGFLPYTAYYGTLGVNVQYAGTDCRDPENRIQNILFIAPRPDEMPAARERTKPGRLSFRSISEGMIFREATMQALPDPDDRNRRIVVMREPLLDESDVADVYLIPPPNPGETPTVELAMTDEGARKLERFTADNIGRRLALVLDDRILMAATISGTIKESLVIDLGGGASPQQAIELSGRIHAAVHVLPADPGQPPGRGDDMVTDR